MANLFFFFYSVQGGVILRQQQSIEPKGNILFFAFSNKQCRTTPRKDDGDFAREKKYSEKTTKHSIFNFRFLFFSKTRKAIAISTLLQGFQRRDRGFSAGGGGWRGGGEY
jgi:hypothetical protein